MAIIEERVTPPVDTPASPEAPSGLVAPTRVFRPTRGLASLQLSSVWAYRELLYFLVWRDVKVRYKQTVLGAGWAVIQPVMTMIIFSVIFGQLARLPSDGLPYPVFALCALLPWNLFAAALSRSGVSLVGSSNLISKVYFPRLILPISTVLGGLVDFAIAFVVLLGLIFYFGIAPTWAVLLLPLFIFFALATALGAGLWLSALNVRYRDIGHVIPFLVQFWMYASPVAYATSLIPESWRVLYGLNPMVGVVEGFRWALLGTRQPLGPAMWVSVVVTLALLVGGAFYFRSMEKTFADVV